MLHFVGYIVLYDSINKIFIAKFAWNDLSLELARSLLVIYYGSSSSRGGIQSVRTGSIEPSHRNLLNQRTGQHNSSYFVLVEREPVEI